MKLFKKVMAAVLAGVMALSMVACGSNGGTTKPEDIPTDTTKSVADQLIDYLNKYGEYASSEFVTGSQVYNAVKFENTLKADAEKILNAIAAGEQNTVGNTLKLTTAQIEAYKKCFDQSGDYTYYLLTKESSGTAFHKLSENTLNGFTTPISITALNAKIEDAKADIVTKYAVSDVDNNTSVFVRNKKNSAGEAVTVAKVQVGFASAKIAGVELVVMVTKAL